MTREDESPLNLLVLKTVLCLDANDRREMALPYFISGSHF